MPSVHVDYTTKSGAERLDALLPEEEAQRLKQTPFAVIQVSLLATSSTSAGQQGLQRSCRALSLLS